MNDFAGSLGSALADAENLTPSVALQGMTTDRSQLHGSRDMLAAEDHP